MIPPILAVDIQAIIAIAVLLISFIGWLSNLISGQQKPPAPRGRRQQPNRDRRIQDEIDSFLREATQGRKGANQRRRPPRQDEVLDVDDIEVIEEPTPARRRPEPPKPRRKPVVTQRPKKKESSFGKSVQSHVKSHMTERIGKEVASHLPHNVDQSITAHLGTFTGEQSTGRIAALETTQRKSGPAPGLLKTLRSPQGVKHAIIVSEILSKPLGLRK